MACTRKDIETYKQVKSDYLDKLYADARMPANEPENRARYLAEEVLGLTMTDHEVIMRAAAEKGRPAALNLLERMAVADKQNK